MRSGLVCGTDSRVPPLQCTFLSGALSFCRQFRSGNFGRFIVLGLLAATLSVLLCENSFISPSFQRLFSLVIEVTVDFFLLGDFIFFST